MSNETKLVYVVWQNTDSTEGKGKNGPIAARDHRATALRLAKGQNVQGSDCDVIPFRAQLIDSQWCGPVDIKAATTADLREQRKLDKLAEAKERATKLGLSPEDIKTLLDA